ncbi:MAG TPA: choice-of-anchor J domain-containing protein [Flavitalea sp.]|nr:choice-of-anchor J domain-containing protein [Flavitalea sp.]
MRNSMLSRIFLCFTIAVTVISCKKDDASKLTPPVIPDQSFVEEFDTVSAAYQRGWIPINNSSPKGSGIWAQGGGPAPIFAPFSSRGSYAGFIAADYLSTSAAAGVISNWLVSPLVWMKNGDKITFYTRTQLYSATPPDSTDYGNNLEVCINRKNESANVGIARDPRDAQYNVATDRGDFEVVLTINPPSYDPGSDFFNYRYAHSSASLMDPLAYPASWTKFEVIVDGVVKPHQGRFAFRYYTLDAGSNGNGSAVAIDKVEYQSSK